MSKLLKTKYRSVHFEPTKPDGVYLAISTTGTRLARVDEDGIFTTEDLRGISVDEIHDLSAFLRQLEGRAC